MPAAIQTIQKRIRLAGATLLEPHGCNDDERSVRRGFEGGRCGGSPPAQERAEGPTAQTAVVSG